jgi:catechol 2,3-dioxygenase-like lactoylglutathione lyase family enzyme
MTNTPNNRGSKVKVSFVGRSITISCTSLERSQTFYEDVLGAVLLPYDGYGCPWYKLGPFMFSLMPNSEKPSLTSPEHAEVILWLEVDDIEKASEHLTKSGVTVLQPSDGQSMMIADPDGITIEIWQSLPEDEAIGNALSG